jgi:cobalt/nickel transport system permease protein
MSDALISPSVGLSPRAVAGASLVPSSGRLRPKIARPLIGVNRAFIFASQMVNFAIPGTGAKRLNAVLSSPSEPRGYCEWKI